MTAMEKWMIETAEEIAKDDIEADRPVSTTLQQRVGISLIQARARECRSLAGEMQIMGLTQNPAFNRFWAALLDRSSKLEAMGLAMVEKYPPDTKPAERNLVVMAS